MIEILISHNTIIFSFTLKYFLESGADFEYSPIDISGNVLNQLKTSLISEMPELNVRPLRGDYFEMLRGIENESHINKLVLFLGSNVGNFNSEYTDFIDLFKTTIKKMVENK